MSAPAWVRTISALEPIRQESYILVHEMPAAAYGFGGKTQEFRLIHGRMESRA